MKHGYLNEEKGPEDMPGVVLREIELRDGAYRGYARWPFDFWPSREAYENDQPGFSGHRKSEVETYIVLHDSEDEAFEAVKKEQKE